MAKHVAVWRPFQLKALDFKNVKRVTVPNQSLSLREIVKRFVRREQLPLSMDGVYEERFGDLEKLSKADIFDQFERAKELAAQIKEGTDRIKAAAEAKEKAEKEAAAAKVMEEARSAATPVQGVTPIKSPPLQGS